MKRDISTAGCRITIPVRVMEALGWEDAEYIMVDSVEDGKLKLRRLIIEKDS